MGTDAESCLDSEVLRFREKGTEMVRDLGVFEIEKDQAEGLLNERWPIIFSLSSA